MSVRLASLVQVMRLCLKNGCAIGNIFICEATKAACPYYLVILIAITLVICVPAFPIWLPTLMTGYPLF